MFALSNQSNESSLNFFLPPTMPHWKSKDARTSQRRRTMPTPATTAALAGRGGALLLRSSASSCRASGLASSRVMETGTCCADSRAITVHHGIAGNAAGNAAGKRTGFADRVGRQRRSVSTLVLLYVWRRAVRSFACGLTGFISQFAFDLTYTYVSFLWG